MQGFQLINLLANNGIELVDREVTLRIVRTTAVNTPVFFEGVLVLVREEGNSGLQESNCCRTQIVEGLRERCRLLNTVLQDGKGGIRIAHAVDGLSQSQIDRCCTVKRDICTIELGHGIEDRVALHTLTQSNIATHVTYTDGFRLVGGVAGQVVPLLAVGQCQIVG